MTSLNDERFNAALREASGNPDRIGEIFRSLDDREILVQRALGYPTTSGPRSKSS